jgi:hypothetical protein
MPNKLPQREISIPDMCYMSMTCDLFVCRPTMALIGLLFGSDLTRKQLIILILNNFSIRKT